ncbi:type A2 lantipeptide [Streptomyces sp. RB6PN25]|uniref:Type A2 lantipeptide n=1 Tax=Streptomyces humicola TaxID=2953240 RepID=A0ABT1PS97_9ACTN|nr:type A2 lantipeptide [Streptomyces humicola]MCQ4079445.1 type A2 lantipeptide [Streptomyces humicola]
MRKDSTQEIETCEIADSDLENVSGGNFGFGSLAQNVESMLPVPSVSGGLPSLSGGLPVESISGAAGLQATGPIPGQAGLAGFAG